ncbi:MAG: hypothetical protein GXO12_03830, partial [Epsilonproteobacteria bacterium]|nr:hypothetical protein [Campylobacterota bacterium]
KQEYRMLNNNSMLMCKIQIDDCIITHGQKCDYLAIKCIKQEESEENIIEALYFIELKGSDLIHALHQIETTIKHTKIKPLLKDNPNIYARIILNKQRTPDIRSSEKIKFEKMIKKLGGNLKTCGKKMIETI